MNNVIYVLENLTTSKSTCSMIFEERKRRHVYQINKVQSKTNNLWARIGRRRSWVFCFAVCGIYGRERGEYVKVYVISIGEPSLKLK